MVKVDIVDGCGVLLVSALYVLIAGYIIDDCYNLTIHTREFDVCEFLF
jgi:hypothetical protein